MTDPKGRGKTCGPDVKAIVERLKVAQVLEGLEYEWEGIKFVTTDLKENVVAALALISQLTAERDANWNEYLEERSARMASNNREFANLQRAEAAEKRVKELEEGRDLDKVVLDEGIEIINELESSNKLLSERVAVLEASLEPFANTCDEMFNDTCPDDIPAWETEFDTSTVTVGDLRRARSALEGK